MAIVGIAGGTGGLGRAIVETIKAQGKHEVIILSRKTNLKLEAEYGTRIIAIDYLNVESLAKALEDNNIDTVISTLNLTASSEPQVNLVRAADSSICTKRFVPSIWGIPFTGKHLKLPFAQLRIEVLEELKKTSLEYTLFYTGYFLDYFGIPHVKTYLQPFIAVVDMVHNTAAIPGSGDSPVVFTHTFDTAKYVAASLSLAKWDQESYIIGDKMSWNEFVKLAEAAKGKGTKFNITYDSLDILRTGKVTELPCHPMMYAHIPKEQLQGMFAIFGIWFDNRSFDLNPKKTVNSIFPDIRPVKVKDFLEQAWKGK